LLNAILERQIAADHRRAADAGLVDAPHALETRLTALKRFIS
jgi:hypothetical protein